MTKAMDLIPSTQLPKSPDSDTDTETPLQTHLTKALSLTNASFKTHQNHYSYISPPPPSQQQVVVSYKECLKNHAAMLGGLALDGCGEFMPKSTATPQEPTSLKCAACGCHRNFHRREAIGPTSTNHVPPPPALIWTTSPSQSPGSTNSGPSPSPASPASATPQSFYTSAPQMLLALSSSGHSAGPLDETPLQKQSYSLVLKNPLRKRRARTKFSEEQKEKMNLFAEKLGWRMLRGSDNEEVIEEFCREVGVNRNTFKVWMHNNRQRKEKSSNTSYGINSSHKRSFDGCDDDDQKDRVFGTGNKDYNFNDDNSNGINSSHKRSFDGCDDDDQKDRVLGTGNTDYNFNDNNSNGSHCDSFDRYQIESTAHVHSSFTADDHGSSSPSS